MTRLAIVALLLLPAAANAAVYKCTVDGRLTFQDHPCAGNSELLLMAPPPVPGGEPPASTSTSDWLKQADKDGKQRQIEGLERQNRALREDLNRQLEGLRKQAEVPGYYGLDAAAKSTAVQKDFDAKIQANQSKIDTLRKSIQEP